MKTFLGFMNTLWLTMGIWSVAQAQLHTYTNISVTVNSLCGSMTTSKRVFIGTPSMPITDPSGYPTVQHSYQGFKNYRVISNHSDQDVRQYNWWVSPHSLTIVNSTNPSCIIEGATQGYHNFYVQLINACGVSPAAAGGIQVGNGETIPDTKRLANPNIAATITSFQVQPNPARHQTQLQLLDAQGGALKINDLKVEERLWT